MKVSREVMPFNSLASVIPKWRAFKLLRWVQNLASQCGTMTFYILIDVQRMNSIDTIFTKKNKYMNVVGG
jgi:hypothetical protein